MAAQDGNFSVSPQISLFLERFTGTTGQILWMTLFFWGLFEEVGFLPVHKISGAKYQHEM